MTTIKEISIIKEESWESMHVCTHTPQHRHIPHNNTCKTLLPWGGYVTWRWTWLKQSNQGESQDSGSEILVPRICFFSSQPQLLIMFWQWRSRWIDLARLWFSFLGGLLFSDIAREVSLSRSCIIPFSHVWLQGCWGCHRRSWTVLDPWSGLGFLRPYSSFINLVIMKVLDSSLPEARNHRQTACLWALYLSLGLYIV